MVAHIPGLKVVMPATVADASDPLVASIEDPNPVVYIENRRLYGMRGSLDDVPLPLGRARVAVAGDDWSSCSPQAHRQAARGQTPLNGR
jgi:pyruvate/2-oxoglutarate/acetoin dehydrogenase E1 component